MADYLFVPQSVLDKWSEQGRIQVDGNVLTILGEQKSFALTSAVRFIKMEAGDDNVGLLAKVKTTDALKQMGAEHYMESVILGESAYQVQQGFLADANALRRAGRRWPGGSEAGRKEGRRAGHAGTIPPRQFAIAMATILVHIALLAYAAGAAAFLTWLVRPDRRLARAGRLCLLAGVVVHFAAFGVSLGIA